MIMLINVVVIINKIKLLCDIKDGVNNNFKILLGKCFDFLNFDVLLEVIFELVFL